MPEMRKLPKAPEMSKARETPAARRDGGASSIARRHARRSSPTVMRESDHLQAGLLSMGRPLLAIPAFVVSWSDAR